MEIMKSEIKKILSLPMLWGFLGICLAMNICLVLGHKYKVVDDTFFTYVAHAADVTGTTIGEEFSERLAALPNSEQKKRLILDTANPEKIYTDYNTAALGEAYIGVYDISGLSADCMRQKYAILQSSVRALDQNNAELSLYAADTTEEMHGLLFGVMLRAVITEACLLAVLIMLYLFTYEYQNRTEYTVYTTKTGRKISIYKLRAGFLMTIIGYIVLTGMTLSVYFYVFDYTEIWRCSVSSGFNYVSDMIGMKPFITWFPFTVLEYLVVILILGLFLALIFGLMGAVIGLIFHNSYVGAVIFLLLSLAMMTAPYVFAETGIWSGYFMAQFSPVCLWFSSPRWFTDMGNVSVIPFHETIGIIVNLVLWGSVVFVTRRRSQRKDVL